MSKITSVMNKFTQVDIFTTIVPVSKVEPRKGITTFIYKMIVVIIAYFP